MHKIYCKLKLLQYGLVAAAGDLDTIKDFGEEDDNDEEREFDPTTKDSHVKIMASREKFTDNAIADALKEGVTTSSGVQTASILEERKRTIRDFYKVLLSRGLCENCGMYSPAYRKDGIAKIFELPLPEKKEQNNKIKGVRKKNMISNSDKHDYPVPKAGAHGRYIMSSEVRNILDGLFKMEQQVMHVLFLNRPNTHRVVNCDMFFLKNIVVPPTRFRLPSKLGEEIHENVQNTLLNKVLTTSMRIRDLNDIVVKQRREKDFSPEERKASFGLLMNSFVALQNDVNGFIDSSKSPSSSGALATPGIKQALEKKEGLFRKNMMGKRVNYAARSVISPDPNIETNEIGVPPVFAVKLTYPEPVTAYNVAELSKAVINGPDVWPGASQVQNEDGKLISLVGMTTEQRTAIASQLLTPSANASGFTNKKVYRHIRNNDVVLMNRQPTLHKASMMGHRVRVLPKEKTLRLHYANTGAYNADFDGDEMNMHFPQNENARAEALLLANTDSQYLTPTSGKPLRGLIQDHISAGVLLTSKDTFFTRQEYQQLVYGSVRPEDGHTSDSARIHTVPPAVMKPYPLWTGKQVITTVLKNITPLGRPGLNLKSSNKVKNEYWGNNSTENTVLFRNGELVQGILDKSQYGAADYGLVHSIHEIYGPHTAGKLMSVLGRLFTRYVMNIGLTCGMDDLWLTEEGNSWRTTTLAMAKDVGVKAAAEVTNLPEDTDPEDPELLKRLEEILRDDNKLGILDAISQSKVNAVTTSVVSQCIPNGTMKRFPENAMQRMALSGAKGSNVNVSQIMCGLGQQALEGRRVPVMVSGKTLPAFKPFETDAIAGGFVASRFFSGIRPQEYYFHCMAGREGLIDTAVKTSRSGYLQRCLIKQLEGVHSNYDNTVRDSDGTLVQFMYGGDAVDVIKESHLQQFDFCVQNFQAMIHKHQPGGNVENLDTESAIAYAKKAKKLAKKAEDDAHLPETTLSMFNPAKYLGSVSDEFSKALETYITDHPEIFPSKKSGNKSIYADEGVTEKKFRSLMQLKYMQSLVNPGEALGIIASQSIGEPSTQMTLNTFHFAGHGAANVTLGIPRMREIIMTASRIIMTPQMSLPVLPDVTDAQAESFCKSIQRVVLSEFVDEVVVTERTAINSGSPTRSFDVRLQFYTKQEYESEYDVSPEMLQKKCALVFLSLLETAVIKELKKQKKDLKVDISKAVPASQTDKAMEAKQDKEMAEELEGEDDSSEAKAKQSTKQAVSYEDDEAVEAAESDSDSDSDSDAEMIDRDHNEDWIDAPKKFETTLSANAEIREQEVAGRYRSIKRFNFDDESGEWCTFTVVLGGDTKKLLMVNIIEDICRACVVRETPGIGRCIFPKADKPTDRKLTTEGVNFHEMWKQDEFIDVNGIYSNDIHSVLKTYGVEAARNTIVQEINNVFKTYAITVNMRHLELIADMMTREGTYLAFSRQGVDSSTSPFLKMSFETTCGFLTKAVLDGDSDTLESPSARIVVGKLAQVGTGSFDVQAPMVEEIAA